jgi:predicted nucleotidyltransferase
VHLTKAGDKAISLKINDSVSAVNYMLSDVSIINEPPQMKQIPNFELEINVTPSLIDKFISGKSALADEDKFTVITDGENTKLVIGYASVNTNRVTIPVTTNTKSLIDKISFNANLFKEVLSANKECESATLYVSSEGLAKITFKVDDFSSTYFFVAAGDID